MNSRKRSTKAAAAVAVAVALAVAVAATRVVLSLSSIDIAYVFWSRYSVHSIPAATAAAKKSELQCLPQLIMPLIEFSH